MLQRSVKEFRTHATHAAGLGASPSWLMSDQRVRLSRSNFRPITTRFEGEARVGKAAFGWTSHAISPHEVLNEEADSINRFRRLHCCALINRDTNCAGEAKMRCRDAIKSARALVLASD